MILRAPLIGGLTLCFCLSASALAQEKTAPPPAKPGPLRFAWPVPSKGTVTQTGLKKGNQVTLRYGISLTAADSGEELRLSFSDFEILKVNGRDVTTPEMKKVMATQVVNLGASFPDLRIGKGGEYLGVVDWTSHVKRCIAALRAVMPNPDEANLERTRETMLDPRYQKMLEAKAGESWQVWVGAWADGEIASGETQTGASQLPVGNEMIDAKLTFSHEGDGGEGHVKLSLATVLEGDEAKAAFVKVLRGMSGVPADVSVDEFRRESLAKVVTDPKTLRPRTAASVMRSLVVVGGKAQRELEKRSYTFEWE